MIYSDFVTICFVETYEDFLVASSISRDPSDRTPAEAVLCKQALAIINFGLGLKAVHVFQPVEVIVVIL